MKEQIIQSHKTFMSCVYFLPVSWWYLLCDSKILRNDLTQHHSFYFSMHLKHVEVMSYDLNGICHIYMDAGMMVFFGGWMKVKEFQSLDPDYSKTPPQHRRDTSKAGILFLVLFI